MLLSEATGQDDCMLLEVLVDLIKFFRLSGVSRKDPTKNAKQPVGLWSLWVQIEATGDRLPGGLLGYQLRTR